MKKFFLIIITSFVTIHLTGQSKTEVFDLITKLINSNLSSEFLISKSGDLTIKGSYSIDKQNLIYKRIYKSNDFAEVKKYILDLNDLSSISNGTKVLMLNTNNKVKSESNKTPNKSTTVNYLAINFPVDKDLNLKESVVNAFNKLVDINNPSSVVQSNSIEKTPEVSNNCIGTNFNELTDEHFGVFNTVFIGEVKGKNVTAQIGFTTNKFTEMNQRNYYRTNNLVGVCNSWIKFKFDFEYSPGINGTNEVYIYFNMLGIYSRSGSGYNGEKIVRPFYDVKLYVDGKLVSN